MNLVLLRCRSKSMSTFFVFVLLNLFTTAASREPSDGGAGYGLHSEPSKDFVLADDGVDPSAHNIRLKDARSTANKGSPGLGAIPREIKEIVGEIKEKLNARKNPKFSALPC